MSKVKQNDKMNALPFGVVLGSSVFWTLLVVVKGLFVICPLDMYSDEKIITTIR